MSATATQTLRPFTLRQLATAHQPMSDGAFQVDSKDVTLAEVVARIARVQEAATHLTFHLHDETAQMEAKWFLNPNEVIEDVRECREGGWVRVFGTLKSFNQKRQLLAHSIRPVTNYHEIMHHLLRTVAHHLQGPQSAGAPPGGMAYASSYSTTTTTTSFASTYPVTTGAPAPRMHPVQSMPAAKPQDLGNPVVNAITEIFSKPDVIAIPEGVHRQYLYTEVQRALRRKPPQHELDSAIEWLLNEGHIYCTLDDDHFTHT